MPNICNNRMTLTGPMEELERFRELFKGFDYQFTYQAIIPQPVGLDVPESSDKPYAVALYLHEMASNGSKTLDTELMRKWDKVSAFGLFTADGNLAADAMKKVSDQYEQYRDNINRYKSTGVACDKCPTSGEWIRSREQLCKLGEQLVFNKATTGSESWYDWNCENWGVKWDAGDCDEVEICGNEISLYFTSPWGPPNKVFMAIIEQFPKLSLTVEVDCEGTGRWTITSENGVLVESDVTTDWDDEEE